MKKKLARKTQTMTYKAFIEAFLAPFAAQIHEEEPIDGSDAVDAIVTFYLNYQQWKNKLN